MIPRSVRKSIRLAIAALALSPGFSQSVPEDPLLPAPGAAEPARPALSVRSNLIRKGTVIRRPAGTRSSGASIILSNGIAVDDPGEPGPLPESGHWIVRFAGPIREEWTVPLRSLGAAPLAYLPDDALIVRAGREAMEEIRRSGGVLWVAPFERNQKLAAFLLAAEKGEIVDAVALLFDGEESAGLESTIVAAGGEIVARSEHLVRFRGERAALDEIARLESVRWIEPWRRLTLFNSDCQWVVQSDLDQVRSVWEHGLRGEGVLLSLCDSGIRSTHEMFRDESRAIGGYGDYPDHRKVVAYRKATDSPFILFGDDPGAYYHGTHTACTLAGNDSTLGGSDTDGIAPDARIFFVDGGGDENVIYTPVDLADLFLPVYEGNGAGAPRIMSNSWGTLGGGEYDFRCEQVDRFVWERKDFLLLFSNGNGAIANSVASPAASKNCIGAGGTENGSDAGEIYAGTSRGPTDDGRRKPTLCAPARLTSASGEGDGEYQTLDGTSMAAPTLAAAAGLVRQYFTGGWYPSGAGGGSPPIEPSAALLKAVLVNGGEGDIAGYPIPSNDVGWGRLRPEDVLYFPGDTRRLAVADEAAGLRTGEIATYEVTVASSAEPLEVTLVWSDYPSTPAATRNLVNDLDLAVRSGSALYLGNVFSGGSSTGGGVRDSINVEECVFLTDPAPGAWTIEVRGAAIPFGPQPFALVITGDLDGSSSSVSLDRNSYGGADTVSVRVEDAGAVAPPTVTIRSDTESDPESLALAGGGGLFTGSIRTTVGAPVSGDGLLSVSEGDSIRVEYADPSPAAVRTAAASVSLTGPVIDPPVAEESGGGVSVRWRTDIPSDSRLLFGLDPAVLADTVRSADLVVDHLLSPATLLPDTTYYYSLSSADVRGNRTVDGGGAEPYRFTTGPREDVLIVIGDLTFEKPDAYRNALDYFNWSGAIIEGTVPPVGDRESGLRSRPVVWWQAGWEEYPPFSGAARETIDRYMEGGGRLAVVSHDAAWAFGDPSSDFRTAETEEWLRDRMRVSWVSEPSYWNIIFGYAGDYISGDYTTGVSYAPIRNGGAGDVVEPAGTAASIDTVWKNNFGDLIGLRWIDDAPSGSAESAVWGGTRARGVSCCFEWSVLNEWNEDDYTRARVFDRTLRWLIGRDHPDLTLTSYRNGGTISGSPATISWNESVYGGAGVGMRRIEWSGDGGGSWNLIDGDAGPSPCSWDLSGVPNGTTNRIRITLFDGGDPHLTGGDRSESDFIVDIPGNDTRGPRVTAGSATFAPNPAVVPGTIALQALLSDSTRGGSPVDAAEWSLGPAAAGEGTAMSGSFGGMTAAVADTIDAGILSAPVDTIWIRGRDGGGVWGEAHPLAVTIQGDYTSIAGGGDLPARFVLHGNAPNPFNPVTTIRFDLPERAHVRLLVYNVNGRLVRSLVDGDLTAGRHRIVWDGRDDSGRPAGSGVYLSRLEADANRAVKKMVLLR